MLLEIFAIFLNKLIKKVNKNMMWLRPRATLIHCSLINLYIKVDKSYLKINLAIIAIQFSNNYFFIKFRGKILKSMETFVFCHSYKNGSIDSAHSYLAMTLYIYDCFGPKTL